MKYLRNCTSVFSNFVSKIGPISPLHKQQNVRLVSGVANDTRDNYSAVGSVTFGALYEKWRQEFETNSVSEPSSSIEHILAHVLKTTLISDVYKNKNTLVAPQDIQTVNFLCSCRLQHLPVQYVLGEWTFRQLTLKMSPPVFIPRPETEQIVDLILPEIASRKEGHILDLCCGSGAIALSLLQEHSEIKATAVDQSANACILTKENAQKNGLHERIRVIQSHVESWKCEEAFDVVVSNPPYIFREDLETLQPEIKMYEDLQALDGGEHGLDVIKAVLDLSSRCLKQNGKLFLEVEPRHPSLLQDYLLQNRSLGLFHANTYPDFYGRSRFVQLIKK